MSKGLFLLCGGALLYCAGGLSALLMDYYQGLVGGGYIWVLWLIMVITFAGGVIMLVASRDVYDDMP